MKQLDNYLDTFKPIINKLQTLGEENVFIGGTFALQLQGINVGRSAGDLDVIVYQPTDEQMEYLKNLRPFEMKNPSDLSWYSQRSHKYKKDGLILDVLTESIKAPESLLKYQYEWKDIACVTHGYNVNPVSRIIEAKSSYRRVKDMEDLLTLKNLNFNA